MAFTPPDPCLSYEVDLSQSLYVPPPCDPYEWGGDLEIHTIINASSTLSWVLDDHIVGGGQKQDLPTALGPAQHKCVWGSADKLEEHEKFPWDIADITDRATDHIPWGSADKLEEHLTSPWKSMGITEKPADEHCKIPWGTFEVSQDKNFDNPWYNIQYYRDEHYKIPWGNFEIHLDDDCRSSFIIDTPIKDMHWKIPWSPLTNRLREHLILHKVGDVKDKHFKFYYGRYPYQQLFYQYYYAPPACYQLEWPSDPLPNLNGCDGSAEIFVGFTGNIQTPYDHWQAGIRDKYLILPPGQPEMIYRKFYYMQNVVLVKRIPDNTPIDVSAVSISTDINSWTWDFNITVMNEAYLELLKPSVAGEDLVLQDIEIKINNNVWICRVESWNETRVFGERGWSVRGRSPSIELGAPYNLPFTYTNTSSRQGGQLIDDLLSGTGWTAEWGFDNDASTFSDVINPTTQWLVPANQFNIQEKTTMEGIKQVLNGIKARIITVPDCDSTNQRLIILPRYRWTPWQWGSKTIDYPLIASYCHEIGADYNHIPKYNFVIASGDNQGVVVSATRNGTAGDKVAPMYTHPLITTQQAGHEAAKNILSKEGMWLNHSIRLLSIDDGDTPTGEIPGLLLPGKLVSFTEGSSWRGVVISVNIGVKAPTDRTGLEVDQTIAIERYLG